MPVLAPVTGREPGNPAVGMATTARTTPPRRLLQPGMARQSRRARTRSPASCDVSQPSCAPGSPTQPAGRRRRTPTMRRPTAALSPGHLLLPRRQPDTAGADHGLPPEVSDWIRKTSIRARRVGDRRGGHRERRWSERWRCRWPWTPVGFTGNSRHLGRSNAATILRYWWGRFRVVQLWPRVFDVSTCWWSKRQSTPNSDHSRNTSTSRRGWPRLTSLDLKSTPDHDSAGLWLQSRPPERMRPGRRAWHPDVVGPMSTVAGFSASAISKTPAHVLA